MICLQAQAMCIVHRTYIHHVQFYCLQDQAALRRTAPSALRATPTIILERVI